MNWPVIRKIIWQPSGGYWLFYWSAIYLAVGMYSIFIEKIAPFELIQVVWLCIIALPLVCNPLARRLNMKENHMFDWFKPKSNVIQFPEIPKTVVTPPEPEKPVTTFYRLGITNNSRVSLQMGYSEITMSADGVDNMIKQLQVFRDQVREYEEHDGEAE